MSANDVSRSCLNCEALARDNERLRGIIGGCVEAMEAARVLLCDLDQDESHTVESLEDALSTAKEPGKAI